MTKDDGSEDWTLITVTHNSADHLARCWSAAALGRAQWLVVDNDSSDDSVGVARELGATVFRAGGNLGFGAGNNMALDRVVTPWVAFVNPDVTIPDPIGLNRLALVSAANRMALVAPQLLNTDGSEQPNARGLPFLSSKVRHRLGNPAKGRSSEYVRTGLGVPTFCAWTIGAAVAGPTNVLRELGGWNSRYFIYYEDHDLGLRSWTAGHPVVLDPTVRWVHEWQRETLRPTLGPWIHELRSARIFYRSYPALLARGIRRPHALNRVKGMQWQEARDP